MLWIVLNTASHAIIGCNTFFDTERGVHQLWVTRANGKSLKIAESTDEQEIETMRAAIDYAVEQGEYTLRLA